MERHCAKKKDVNVLAVIGKGHCENVAEMIRGYYSGKEGMEKEEGDMRDCWEGLWGGQRGGG